MTEDSDLWQAVADTVRPLGSKQPQPKAKTVSVSKKLTLKIKPLRQEPQEDFTKYKELEAGDIEFLDRKNGLRFRSGEMPMQATLDLHGHTLESGEKVFKDFIVSASKRHLRCLLIITGRGGFFGRGVLRADLPRWINSPEVRGLILAFANAQPKDGGDGAFYVLLKRHRKDRK